jgi:hypothetical protein
MLVLSCQVNDLRNFGFGDLVRVNAADADTLPMYMQHDLRGFFVILAEEALQHVNDELHGSVIVVQQQNLVHRRFLRFRARFGYDTGGWARAAVLAGAPLSCADGSEIPLASLDSTDAGGLQPGTPTIEVKANARNCHHRCLSGRTEMLPSHGYHMGFQASNKRGKLPSTTAEQKKPGTMAGRVVRLLTKGLNVRASFS